VIALHNPHIAVTVLDRDAARIASWQGPHLPIHEPGLNRVVRLARDGGSLKASSEGIQHLRPGNLFFSTDSAASISRADLIFLAVNTPTKYSGRGAGAASDLAALEGATRDIARFAQNGAIIVEKSTVPVGTVNLITDTVCYPCARRQF
jgi:UDPglucose 6-dehydrogenase